jgi:methionyl-tRNA formyltransferase
VRSLLDLPRHGFLNVHASILPYYRGAAPIQRAIERGERETGVTIMRVDEELDHGPMLEIAKTPIGADEHTPALAARLSRIGAEALARVLARLDSIEETPQDHSQATHAPKIEKSEGQIDWSAAARSIYDKFRAFDPWPGVFTRDGIKLLDIALAPGGGQPGEVRSIDDGVTIACGAGAIRVIAMQRPGKPRAAAADIARGLGWRAGTRLS